MALEGIFLFKVLVPSAHKAPLTLHTLLYAVSASITLSAHCTRKDSPLT